MLTIRASYRIWATMNDKVYIMGDERAARAMVRERLVAFAEQADML
jgi:hypothetical protein